MLKSKFSETQIVGSLRKHARTEPRRLPAAAKHGPRADDDHHDPHHQQHHCRERHTGTPLRLECGRSYRVRVLCVRERAVR
jgi:hypothetical protein